MQQKNFTVYKSSAGSGKTYTLVKEYLRIALSDIYDPPQLYRKIIAITFTNKAAAEMKARIIEALKELSNPKSGIISSLAKDLSEEMKLDAFTLANRSTIVLRAILHNYTDFAIGTIDSFTHRIVRAFAHDLHLPVNFEVETDADKLIREAVDILISNIGDDEKLTEVLVQFSESKADEEKTWQIEGELRIIAKHLLREEGSRNADKLRHLKIEDFLRIRDVLSKSNSTFEEKISSIAKEGIDEIEKAGIDPDQIAYGKAGIAGRLSAYAKKDFENFGKPNSNIDKMLSGGKWHSGKASKEIQSAISSIQSPIEKCWMKLEELKEKEFPDYVFRGMIRKNIYALAVLNEIEKIIHSFRSEQNILHISEFNKIISQVVFAEPVPFIYERLGEKYANYLIDEFQDTSVVQWQNLLPLVENSLAGANFNMLVGDGKQAIYRWRGGEVDQFAKLPYLSSHTDNPLIKERELSLVRNHTEKYLAKNWRSKKEIVDFNNAFFRSLSTELNETSNLIYDRLEQESDPKNTGGYVRIEAVETDEEDQLKVYIDKTIALIHQLKKESWSYSEIAILCRTNIEGSEIATALLESGVPVLSSESLLLKHSPVVSFMVSLLRCIDHPADELASAQVLEYLVSTEKLKQPLHECLKEFSESSNDLSLLLKKNKIVFDALRFARLPIYQRCEELIHCFDLGKETDSYLLFFLDEVLNYISSRNKDKTDFFDWWEDRSRKASIVVPEGMDAVTVMTIHKSKGLEFPVVILPFANWKIAGKTTEKWIDFNDPEIPELTTALISLNKDLQKTHFAEVYEEEKSKNFLDVLNVLYVAMTRPVQRLYIFTEVVTKAKEESKTISDFFYSALEKIGNPFSENISEFGKPGSREISDNKKIICIRPANINSHNWEERIRIRSTSADHWDIDDATGLRDKGNLVHEILAAIDTVKDIDQAIENAIQSGITDSTEGKQIRKLLSDLLALPELENCFSGKGKIRKETELLLPDGKRLRPDRVIENPKEIIILDYKTGEKNPKHKKQLDRYAEVLTEMGYSNIQKKIVYTETLKVESW